MTEPLAAEPTLSEPLARLAQSFKATLGAVRRLRGRETQHLDKLSHAQYGLLFGLAAERELSASKLAYVADLAPATVTQMLDHLEAVQLVRRVRSALDKRVVLVSLTERGRALVEDRRSMLEGRWEAAMVEFSDDELLSAAAVLDRLRDLFEALERE
ncbi:MAG: MarR family winged helix-turn-helix transcriptional regulator [Solirubrobacteraceae bacterium]